MIDYNYMTYAPFEPESKMIQSTIRKIPVRKSKLAENHFLTTIILSHYNRPKLLKKAIDSLLKCSSKISHFQLLVVDDGSNIEEIDPIIEQYGNGSRFHYFCLAKNTANEAIVKNIGASLSNTKYICFVDSDDEIIDPNIIDKSVQIMEENPDVLSTISDIVYQIEMKESELPEAQRWILNTEKLPANHPLINSPFPMRRKSNDQEVSLLKNLTYGPDGVRVHRLSAFKKAGGSHEDAIHGEACFYLRIHQQKGTIAHIPSDAYLYRIHNHNQLSSKKKSPKELFSEREITFAFLEKQGLSLDNIEEMCTKKQDFRFFEKFHLFANRSLLFEKIASKKAHLSNKSSFRSQFPNIYRKKKGLAFFAHQDDETLGASTFLQHFGSQIEKIIYPTNGALKGDRFVAKQRRKEALKALSCLNISEDKVEFWDNWTFGDEKIIQRKIDQTIEIIDRIAPDFILLHDFEGGHPDHDWVFAQVSLALQKLGRSNTPYISFPVYNLQHQGSTKGFSLDDLAEHNLLVPRKEYHLGKIYTHTLSKHEFHIKEKMLRSFDTQLQDVSYFDPWIKESYFLGSEFPHPTSLCSKPFNGTLFYEFVNAGTFEDFSRVLNDNIKRLGLLTNCVTGN